MRSTEVSLSLYHFMKSPLKLFFKVAKNNVFLEKQFVFLMLRSRLRFNDEYRFFYLKTLLYADACKLFAIASSNSLIKGQCI